MNEWLTEIRWKTITTYVDLHTGEILTEENARDNYIVKHTKKETNVYKSTGTVKITKECEKSNQLKLFH